MKTFMRIILVLVVVFSTGLQPAYADRGGHRGGRAELGVFLGPGWWGPYPYPYYSYPYYPYYSPPPVIVEQPPEIYVQPSPPVGAAYWYYCQDPQGYYPTVKRCPKGWMKVVPPAQGEE